MTTLSDALIALYVVRKALQKVLDNQEYQKRSGGKYFTSAQTEYEWKHDSQKETDAAVTNAIKFIDDFLSGRS